MAGRWTDGSRMPSYSVSHVMDCVAVSSGIRYEMRTGRGRDDERDDKRGAVSMMTSDDIIDDMR